VRPRAGPTSASFLYHRATIRAGAAGITERALSTFGQSACRRLMLARHAHRRQGGVPATRSATVNVLLAAGLLVVFVLGSTSSRTGSRRVGPEVGRWTPTRPLRCADLHASEAETTRSTRPTPTSATPDPTVARPARTFRRDASRRTRPTRHADLGAVPGAECSGLVRAIPAPASQCVRWPCWPAGPGNASVRGSVRGWTAPRSSARPTRPMSSLGQRIGIVFQDPLTSFHAVYRHR